MSNNLLLPFFLALLAACFGTAYFSHVTVVAFAPFLVMVLIRKSLLSSLWIGFLCGLIMDMLASETSFGLYSLNYCITMLLLYPQKKNFFEDKPLSFSLFTYLFSFVSTLFSILCIKFSNSHLAFSLSALLKELFVMPLLDAFYAFIWFTSPLMGIKIARKMVRSFQARGHYR